MRRRLLPLLPLLLVGSACSVDGIQSVGGRDGQGGAAIADLFGIFLVATLLFAAVVAAFLGAAALRRRGRRADGIEDPEGSGTERPLKTGLIVWIAAVAIGLFGLTLASHLTDRSMARALPDPASALRIEIVANQWWWDVRYHFRDPSRDVRTANELHLPAGVPAHVTLKSNDVIHSFWVPNLAGKQDLIPGRITDLMLIPRKTGVYRGQCAEFCGMQHAHMALDVTVEPREAFERWRAHNAAPAVPPTNALTRAGYDYFTTRECSTCHAIAGTPASGQVAPDLTHFASRRSIAAGTLPMSRGHIYAWIADPQGPKPGNAMPYIGLEADELHAVAAYLESLK
ncbi:cytochrome c oxidase subunit II [Sphingomonas parva]|uniref:Cytochrome aa3 subunit 2 n=1 Tax=Sphingomonas parva TaxID=2555898 RepID=A0A4Y8ZVY5_9SPHN|nr:cytochrome c oxidase subunit II [Sphingomonas parva]TFI58879.1 cytochrome c oxidase subunit II [Sphingomonas parva]